MLGAAAMTFGFSALGFFTSRFRLSIPFATLKSSGASATSARCSGG